MFNLSIEPLVLHLQEKLQGLTLSDSTFKLRLFADDVTVGLQESDKNTFQDTWSSYAKASQAKDNLKKSVFWSYPNNTEFKWLEKAGYQRLPTESSTRILGFHVKRDGSGDSTFWQTQITNMKQSLSLLNKRAASLRGRSLCVKAKLQSLVTYHARLCPPLKQEQETIDQVAWNGQWKGKVALKPSRLIGSLPWLKGGSNFSKIEWIVESSLAMWFVRLLQGDQHLWAKEGRALIRKSFSEGMWALVRQPLSLPRKSLGPRWTGIMQAWWKMNPRAGGPAHPAEILAWPVFRDGIKWSRYRPIVYDRVTFDKTQHKWRLRTHEELQDTSAAAKVIAVKELSALRLGKVWKANQIGNNLQLLSSPVLQPVSLSQPTNIMVAGLSLDQISCRTLRNWRRDQSTKQTSADLQNQKIGEYGDTPADVWRIVHHPVKSTQV